MRKYIVLCDHNVPWCKKIEQIFREYKIEVIYIELLEDALDKVKGDMCCLLVCSEYELDEYCKAHDINMETPINKITGASVNTAVISDCASENRELEFLERGAVEYQWREKDIQIIIRRLIIAAGLKSGFCIKNYNRIYESLHELDRSEFTAKEMKVLEVIASYNGNIVSRDIIIDKIWGEHYSEESRALDTIIKKVRKKINIYNISIENKYGEGYYIVNKAL